METTVTSLQFTANHTNGSSCSRDNVVKTVVFPVLYSILFLLGLLLNSVAAWVFLRIPSKSHFIIYLKNIVVADIVMTFTFPFKVCFDWNSLFTKGWEVEAYSNSHDNQTLTSKDHLKAFSNYKIY